MKKVGILSDTHCTLIPQLFDFFKDVDELWHAGDIGNIETAEALAAFKPLRAVHGNIDDHVVRMQYPEDSKRTGSPFYRKRLKNRGGPADWSNPIGRGA